MDKFQRLQERYGTFIEERNWSQFHTPRNVATAISVECNELLELFLWKGEVSAEEINESPEFRQSVEEEVADVLIYCMSLGIHLDLDLLDAVEDKLEANEERFDEEHSAEITEQLEQWHDKTGRNP